MQLIAYLNFAGQCADAFRFYHDVLGGELTHLMTMGDAPGARDVPPETRDRIMHARLVVGDAVLMGSDGPPGYSEKAQGIWVNIWVTDVADAERIFAALSEGGTVVMPMEKTFWAERFGMVKDRFGTPWMVNCGE
jgi:PhnB protein